MQITALSSGIWGMADAARRYDTAAKSIATGSPDLPKDLVQGTILAPIAYSANATVIRAADETYRSLVDVLA